MLSEKFARALRAVSALGAALVVAVLAVQAQDASLRGRLEPPADGEPLRLAAADGTTVELASDESIDRAMRDPRLAGRLWDVRGTRRDDGRFAVEKAYTVKDGEIHRVTYYCVICHITTHEPGRCMCCQGDTDLREIPGE